MKPQFINKEKLKSNKRGQLPTVLSSFRQWSVRMARRGTQGRHRKTKCIILIGPGPTDSLHTRRDHTGRTPRVPLNQVDREQRRSEDPQQVLYWGSGWSAQAKAWGADCTGALDSH